MPIFAFNKGVDNVDKNYLYLEGFSADVYQDRGYNRLSELRRKREWLK